MISLQVGSSSELSGPNGNFHKTSVIHIAKNFIKLVHSNGPKHDCLLPPITTDRTKHPRHVQTNFTEFLILYVSRTWKYFRALQVYWFCEVCQEIVSYLAYLVAKKHEWEMSWLNSSGHRNFEPMAFRALCFNLQFMSDWTRILPESLYSSLGCIFK